MLLDYIRGNKADEYEAHLAECANCRTVLLMLLSEEKQACAVSDDLANRTFDAIESTKVSAETMSGDVRFTKTNSRHAAFRFYALAAGIAVFLTAGIVFVRVIRFHKDITPVVAVVPPEAVNPNYEDSTFGMDAPKLIHDDTVKKLEKQAGFENDREHLKPIRIPQNKERIMRFSGKTIVVAEPLTEMNVKDRTDSTILLEMNKGIALFSIEKKRFRAFIVQTPHVRIAVTGTVFSVAVDSGITHVNVYEGSVLLRHEMKADMEKVLDQGNGVVADNDSMISAMIENSHMVKTRGQLLRDYIQGTIIESGMRTFIDTEIQLEKPK
jgi:hypothetical protein